MSASPPSRPSPPHGRGAKSNETSRFESLIRQDFDDGWTQADAEAPKLKTTLQVDNARTILNRNDSPDIGFDRSINPYRGCEHGCIYCFARPTHAYLGLSPGLDFESRLFFKPEAARLLEKELSRPSYRPQRIQLGANTDPYQPIERKLRITRGVLEVLERFAHPVGITTKNALIARDADILGRMGRAGLAMAAISLTTLDRKLARAMEPRGWRPSPCSAPPACRCRSASRRSSRASTTTNWRPCLSAAPRPELASLISRSCAFRSRSRTCSANGLRPSGRTGRDA